jgi:hypothetical protein
MKTLLPVILVTMSLATSSALGMKKLTKIPKPLKIEGAETIADIRYLPEWRYVGRDGPFGDWEMTMNLYLPKDRKAGQRLPLVMFVHGGAYSAGHKDDTYPRELLKKLVSKGFAVGSMNYILRPKGIFPQVWWDFEEAARFLRSNAKKYGLNPNAFGAVGISAGGWLITTTGHSDGTLFTTHGNTYVSQSQLKNFAYTPRFLEGGSLTFLRPTLATTTAYPGVSGRWQVLAYDFSMLGDRANSFTPALIGMVGKKHTTMPKALAKAGADWTPLVLSYPPKPDRYDRGVHAPDMKVSTARKLDGSGEAPMSEVLAEMLRRKLIGSEARTPAPEIWPTDRRATGPVNVTMVTTDPAITVHYTLDGSKPTAASPKYTGAIQIKPGTRIRAMALMKGKPASRVVEATYIKGPQKPVIVAPAKRKLPEGQTGKPYRLRFNADLPKARFCLQGDLAPQFRNHPKPRMHFPNGMALAGDGTFSGTPKKPGTYWIQVWVNDGPGRVATHRDFIWTVTGKDLSEKEDAPRVKADTYTQIATLDNWTGRNLKYVTGQMLQAGIPVALQPLADKQTMLLVPADQKEAAIKALKDIHTRTGQKMVLAE